MINLSKRERTLLIITGVMIFFALYYSYFLSPILKNISDSRANIAIYENELGNLKLTQKLNEKQKKELEVIRDGFEDAAKALPKMERSPEIAYNLKVLGDEKAIIINSLSFGEPSEYKIESNDSNNKADTKDSISEGGGSDSNKTGADAKNQEEKLYVVAVNLSVSGDYINIMDFISSVENDKRIAEITDVNMSRGQNGKLSAKININYYYVDTKDKGELKYDFNNRSYGKQNPFE
ncbi:type 4a pilus biogenesis protein PilO [Fonticella tunisiensis]|uniref:Pilus assembly protein PilO n=1 Tax=Fonticella tunisiensis TaxID=1096341 RepID=A0A4R7KUX9_9CLOT|nr:type 4a pilus biogenesis protein PilO [Fonticella tunisiensis]TDT61960.1 pilus assembly protein PilO [Fonticella tunisiensis]